MTHEPPPDEPRPDPDLPAGIRYDPDLAVHEPIPTPTEPFVPSRRRAPLLLFPAGVLLLSVMIYILFGLISHEGKRSADYLDDIRIGRASAWQSAFELSRVLRTEDPSRRDGRFATDLIAVFERAAGGDERLRRYLALSLGELKDPRAVAPLSAALADSDLETRLYAAWALGAIGDRRAAPALRPLLEDREPSLRKMAAYALGALASPEEVEALVPVLNDPVDDVAWNAALSLARLGDPSGVPLLVRMLDRDYLGTVSGADEQGRRQPLTEGAKEEAMVNALRALARVGDRAHLDALRRARDRDPSLTVRQAAIEALQTLEPARRP